MVKTIVHQDHLERKSSSASLSELGKDGFSHVDKTK